MRSQLNQTVQTHLGVLTLVECWLETLTPHMVVVVGSLPAGTQNKPRHLLHTTVKVPSAWTSPSSPDKYAPNPAHLRHGTRATHLRGDAAYNRGKTSLHIRPVINYSHT